MSDTHRTELLHAAVAWHVHNTPLDPSMPADRSPRADLIRADLREQAAARLHEAVTAILDGRE